MRRTPPKAPRKGGLNACLDVLRQTRPVQPRYCLVEAATGSSAQQLGTAYYHAKNDTPVNMAAVDNGSPFRAVHGCRSTQNGRASHSRPFPALRLPPRPPTLSGFCAPVRGTAAALPGDARPVNGTAESLVYV
ncbi:hypothetical protein GCM10007301_47570 [Azorhizobium oxalatiphilum]|uniref:Uncharacterized protein n=1 Tax=Azorhizobium oxalatiphilum TaxID=980631 RepID=A0A917CAU7_9HYPH|nr:hypothetical protein GCM10007301_47570 [Azorhizobium oxalatiphilum]